MFLSPSAIHYIDGGESALLGHGGGGALLDVARRMVEKGDQPKLQVVEKDGHWFSLNAAHLALCRRLEQAGKCARVRADVVPLSEVPEHVRSMMVPPAPPPAAIRGLGPASSTVPIPPPGPGRPNKGDDQSRSTGRGYQKLDTREAAEQKAEAESDSDGSSSDNSDFEESDSECDWSQDEGESSECGTSGDEDGDKSTDDERECLL